MGSAKTPTIAIVVTLLAFVLLGCSSSSRVSVDSAPLNDGDSADILSDVAVDQASDLLADSAPDAAAVTCTPKQTSTLPGVNIALKATNWSFTLEQAKNGIQIDYELVIDAPLSSVKPTSQDSGGCGQPGPSGLILFERLSGGAQSYCVCDTGLCAPTNHTADLVAGRYPGQFKWDGRNWFGPSDTGNPKGAPFPPGTYDLTVSAKGSYLAADFEVSATCSLVLTP